MWHKSGGGLDRCLANEWAMRIALRYDKAERCMRVMHAYWARWRAFSAADDFAPSVRVEPTRCIQSLASPTSHGNASPPRLSPYRTQYSLVRKVTLTLPSSPSTLCSVYCGIHLPSTGPTTYQLSSLAPSFARFRQVVSIPKQEPSNMALGSTARPLLVPAADVLAKNMRAIESAQASSASTLQHSPSNTVSPTLFMGLGTVSEQEARVKRSKVRFRRATPDSKPNPIGAFFSRIFSSPPSDSTPSSRAPQKSGLQESLEKLLPPLEKASAIASRLPDPTILILALVLTVLLVTRFRPHYLHSIIVKIGVILSFFPLFALALLWRKTELFAQLREGQNPLSHPAEHRLDGLEAELKEREEKVKCAEETLCKNRAQLDALRKELAKDPNSHDPDAVIVPSRKAAAMIAAGALGAGYDPEAAQAVEARRKEESVKRSREEWRMRTEKIEGSVEQTKESLRLMADHAATAYTKRTRELKSRNSSGPNKAEKLMNLSRLSGAKNDEEELGRRSSRQSERSTATSMGRSTSSRRKLGLFRRRRKHQDVSTEPGSVMQSSQSESRLLAE